VISGGFLEAVVLRPVIRTTGWLACMAWRDLMNTLFFFVVYINRPYAKNGMGLSLMHTCFGFRRTRAGLSMPVRPVRTASAKMAL
jgi:hypothetical protein